MLGKALICHQYGSPFTWGEVELTPLQDQEVLVKLVATGICHTDISMSKGWLPIPPPMVLGHEGAGVVQQVGSKVTNVKEGDHVLLSFTSCDSCRSCEAGRPFCCPSVGPRNFGCRRPDGTTPLRFNGQEISSNFFGQSSFCNPAIVQAGSCVPIDPSYPLAKLAPLGCSVQAGVGAVMNVVEPERRNVQSIAIFGIGGVGCAAVMASKELGIRTIVAIDVVDTRLELAKRIGATETINSSLSNAKEEIIKLTGGVGIDAVVDCTSIPAVAQSIIEMLAPGGIAAAVGFGGRGHVIPVNIGDHIRLAKTYCGVYMGNSDPKRMLPLLAKWYAESRLPLDEITKAYDVADAEEAFKDMIEGRVIKPILMWDSVPTPK